MDEPDALASPADPIGAATRFARSMLELVVGAPRADTAERVVSAGTSIVEFVGTPVRKALEPAIDNRVEAAQDALVALVDVTRVVVQEAIDIVDLNAVLDGIDLNALLQRIDVSDLIRRVDINALMERVDVDELIGRVDVNELIKKVDVNELIKKVDVTEVIARVDIEAVLDRVDINELVEKVDLDGIVERTEVGSLIVRSTSGVATEALDAVRSGAVGLDSTLSRFVDRVLRRRLRPAGPGLLAPDPSA